MRGKLVSFVSGALFGSGLALGGMTRPDKVIGFLDVFGDWDPSLVFVMVGALAVYAPMHRLVTKRERPLFTSRFVLPTPTVIDGPLVVGAVLFGVGWGLSGFCPGPAIAAMGAARSPALIFGVSMLLGMGVHSLLFPTGARSLERTTPDDTREEP